MRIIKKDGTLQDWDDNKIKKAVNSSATRVNITLSDSDYEKIIKSIKNQLEDLELDDIPILTMHRVVEVALEELNPSVAKSYRDYRNYKQEFVEMLDKVYRKSQQIRFIGDKDNANTDSALVATKRCLIFNEFNKNLYRKFFMTRDELQACKDGYIYIHDQSARLDTVNCFHRSTRFITNKGICSFYDFMDGDTCMVLSHKGIWRKATVHSYGWQKLYKITLKRGASYTKEIYATRDHRWILQDGITTTNLKVGDHLYKVPDITKFNWEDLTRLEKKLWCYGFAMGDGSIVVNNGMPNMIVRLCGKKNQYISRFEDAGYSVTQPKSLNGDSIIIMTDIHEKEIPWLILNETNVLYFINGFLCADGNHSLGENTYSEFRGVQITGSEENRSFYHLLNMAGYFITSSRDLTGTETNYGIRSDDTKIYQLYSNVGDKPWKVINIEPAKLNPKSQVWCLEVEEDHSFLLEGGIPTGNCCLSNVDEIMRGGFEMGNIWYNEPKTADTAFDVMGDIILNTASQQYGGYTVPEVDKIISYYAKKSYDMYFKEYLVTTEIIDESTNADNFNLSQVIYNKADKYAIKKVQREIEQGFQGIEMKLNSVGSSRGDYPFITMTFGLATDRFGKMASITFLKVHAGGQGKKGFKKPVLFPKLVFLYDENLHGPGKPLEDVFEEGIKCSSITMYPDWLSLTGDGYVPSIYKKYNKVISPMGCVQKDELVTYKLNNELYVESIGKMWNRLKYRFIQKEQISGEPHMYMDVDPKLVQIYDKENGFVGTTRMVKNMSNNWARVTFSNGRMLECTLDHPLPVIGKGRTFVSDLKIGDKVPLNKSQYVEETYNGMNAEIAWSLGIFICDGCYDDQLSVTIGLDEEEIINPLSIIMKKYYNTEMNINKKERGTKGNYLSLNFTSPKNISIEFNHIFGGLQKIYRSIPNYIFNSNKDIRLAFLAGMIDADGYINNCNNVSIIQLGSTNKELALQQMALMQSLGIRSKIYPNKYDKKVPSKIRYIVEGEAINELKDYIKCSKKLNNFNTSMRKNTSICDIDEGTVTNIEILSNRVDWSYDVTTESDHFDVSGIYSHNCRAFLSPWFERGGMEPADENDEPVFVGRFNIGAVSLNLPMILAKSRQENKDFYEVLDFYLEMIRGIHKRTYDYIGELKASVNPVMCCEGGFYGGHLQPHEKMKKLLKPMTASFGITALNELQQLYNHKSIREDGEFALEVLQYINNKVNEYKKEDGWLYAIYGTPAESLCFAADTEVQVNINGKDIIKHIEDIVKEDLVYSFNPITKRIELKKVLASNMTNASAKVIKVNFTNNQSIICTPNHRFGVRLIIKHKKYSEERIEWINAENLKHGFRIKSNDITKKDNNYVISSIDDHVVDSIEIINEEIPVYDIEVENNHNFFVGGNNGILVHNCSLQVEQFRKMYGIIENVSDKPYVSNSFHCHVSEDMSPIEKQDKENRFWDYMNGGKIQYVRYPISYNIEAIRTLVRRAMQKGFYEGVNLSLAYCDDCGHQELEMDICPKCGSKNLTKIDRMNGSNKID